MLVAESPWGISDQNRNQGKMDGCEEFHNEISSSLKTLKEGTMRGYLRLQYFIEEIGNIVHHKLTWAANTRAAACSTPITCTGELRWQLGGD